ncbi:DgyrCDS10116 [Dimorphilus gyrociliatus]|uniref:DgyrCDS10116 n=1 Tax=Dimorphilus gyrociliatus TaxID=2664684 RepID=A0A7I8W4B9_9ANNE|nr:DgyrCDS10116 [Dimorphilus gyrociliatus]
MVCIAVLGCGLLGVKIAGEMAYHGHKVKLYDSNLTALNAVYDKIEEDKEWMKSEGLLSNNTFIGQIYCLSRLEDAVKHADFVFEAVVDDLPIKQDLFERVTQCCPPNCIVATNTLRLDITAIVERATNKERTVGLRFLYPVYYIPEVEITPGGFTSGKTIETGLY